MLWFDVGVKRYTTTQWESLCWQMLWFDVGVKRYTTCRSAYHVSVMLWFDVGVKRYTTYQITDEIRICCGLMLESKDIQLLALEVASPNVVV